MQDGPRSPVPKDSAEFQMAHNHSMYNFNLDYLMSNTLYLRYLQMIVQDSSDKPI
jgi:hypothetical protein